MLPPGWAEALAHVPAQYRTGSGLPGGEGDVWAWFSTHRIPLRGFGPGVTNPANPTDPDMPADFYAAPSLYLAPWQEYASNLQTQAFVWAVENGQAQDTPAELGRFIHEGRKGASSWAEWYRRAADAVGAEFAGSAALTLAELVARNMDPRDYGFPTWTPADYVPPGPEKDAIYEREMWGGDRVVENPGVMEVGGFSRPVLMAEPEEPTPTAIQNAAAGRVAAREIDAATTYLTQNDPGTPAGELVPFSGDMEALKGVDASLSISWGTVAFLALLALGIYVAQRMGLF